MAESPVTFKLQTEDIDKVCKLGYDDLNRQYILYIDDVLVSELPAAPAITKDHVPPVCRSDVHEFIGETVTRLTWTLFLFGVCTPFTAEFNRRMQTGTFRVDGKIIC